MATRMQRCNALVIRRYNKGTIFNQYIRLIQTDTDRPAHLNQLVDSAHNHWLNTAQSFVRKPIPLPKGIDTTITNKIDKQQTGQDLLTLLIDNATVINHNAIYNKAMQKCGMLKDFRSLHEIFKTLLSHSTLKPDLLSFNIFLNNMALLDGNSDVSIEYLDIMLNEYNIKPDVITFAAIIKALRRRGQEEAAGKCWKIMTDKFKLKPHEILYCEMISTYSRAGKMKKATKIFNEYLNRVNNKELKCDIIVFNAYLNGFSREGDIKGMNSVMKMVAEYGLNVTVNSMADVMRGCFRSDDYKQCLKVFQQWIDNGNKPNMGMMVIKCAALAKLIQDAESWNKKQSLYLRLLDTIERQVEFYGLEVNQHIAKTQLDGAINLYQDDVGKIVEVLEALLEKKLIGYLRMDEWSGELCVDLHMFSLTQARFILRYLFGFKLRDLLGKDGELRILVGKGVHTPGDGRQDGRLREMVIQELGSWKPCVKCEVCENNKGLLIVKKHSMMAYLQRQMHFDMLGDN